MWQWLTGLINPLTSVVKGWQSRKQAKLESELKVNEAQTEAKIRLLAQGQSADIAWNNLSIKNSGWKDEWFTVVLSIPAIMAFIPQLAPFVEEGFKALALCPEWYKWCLMIAVASSFGYKKIADFMALKKGV